MEVWKIMNYKLWHTWVRLRVSQLSVVLGKLIDLLEHISSTRMESLLPQCLVVVFYPYRRSKIHYQSCVTQLIFYASNFISAYPPGRVCFISEAQCEHCGEQGERNNHRWCHPALLTGCALGQPICSHGSTRLARLSLSGCPRLLSDQCHPAKTSDGNTGMLLSLFKSK